MLETSRHYFKAHPDAARVTILVALTLCIYQGLTWYSVYQSYAHQQTLVERPFTLRGTGLVDERLDEAIQARIEAGDRVLSLNGVPLRSQSQYRSALMRAKPGQVLSVETERAGGTRRDAPVRLRAIATHASKAQDWTLFAVASVFMPALCLCLGLGVVWAKPGEKVSWLFLALMISFSQIYHFSGWEGPGTGFVTVFRSVAASTLGISLTLATIYFPRRGAWDVRRPWLKYFWLAPQGVLAAWIVLELLVAQVSFAGSAVLQPHLTLARGVLGIMILASVAAFIVSLVARVRSQVRSPLSADEARRMRIILAGVVVAFTPMCLVAANGLVRNVEPMAGAPRSVMLLALLSLNVFPLSLAYVLVAHRVMGLRTLALQGLLTGRTLASRNAHLLLVMGSLVCLAALLASHLPFLLEITLGCSAFFLLVLATLSGRSTTWLEALLFPESKRAERLLLALEDDNVRSLETMLERITSRLNEAFCVPALALVAQSGRLVPVAAAGGETDRNLLGMGLSLAMSSSIAERLTETAEPQDVYFDGSRPWVEAVAPEEKQFLQAAGSALLLPLVRNLRLMGVLSLGSKPSEEPYTPGEIALLRRLAAHTSLAIENSFLMSSLASEVAMRERQSAEQKAAEQANAAKSDFLAKMSHELRTPLNAIIGYSELLQEIAEEESLPDFVTDLGKIRSAGKHLLQLINSVLDISKIEAGRMELFVESCNVKTLLGEVVDIVQTLMSMNRNRLVLEWGEGLGVIEADATKLRQSLFNLLSNAAKFTRDGTITLGARRVRVGEGEQLELSVADTGIGIPEEKLGQLFGAFMQADASISRDYGGTGLGLAISRQFCRMMAGDITVTSVAGKGSVFTITLPAGRALAAAQAEQAGGADGLTTLLVIDDDSKVHEIVRRFLASEPFHVYSAYSGKEGLEEARRLRPQIITLDVLMPDVQGWSVLAELRSDPEVAEIPVVMLTIVDDRRTGFAVGSNGYLLKPITRTALTTALAEVLGTVSGQSSILVVDDDADGRTLLRGLLARPGCTVLEAGDGVEGMRQLAVAKPDLILLDLIMPQMDGFSFLAEMRSCSEYERIPVIVMTSKDLTLAERQLLDNQASRVMQKGELNEQEFISELYRRVPKLGKPTERERV